MTRDSVIVYEVGPRDGLQGLPKLSTESKIKYIDLLSDSGLRFIETVSFVKPEFIPQMEDALEVAKGLKRKPGVTYSALVPSIKYYPQAKEANMPEVAVFISANEEHNKKNLGRSIDETKPKLEEVIQAALQDGKRVRGYISTVFGYHFPDDTPVDKVIELSRWYLDKGVYQVSLGDTEGVASSKLIKEELKEISNEINLDNFALHLHTKRESMKIKIDTAFDLGVRTFDSSCGGIGGCPTNALLANVDTLELAGFMERKGVHYNFSTGIDLDKLVRADEYIRGLVKQA